jgi:hypothetical protein
MAITAKSPNGVSAAIAAVRLHASAASSGGKFASRPEDYCTIVAVRAATNGSRIIGAMAREPLPDILVPMASPAE